MSEHIRSWGLIFVCGMMFVAQVEGAEPPTIVPKSVVVPKISSRIELDGQRGNELMAVIEGVF